ncbi:hypothetical protein BHM03_00035567 [Ensete ventricosum]|nr:hypothetical protein BHM03_00035567 [Ensete ventricosum]
MTARRKQGAGGSSNDAAVHDQSERQQHHRWRGGSGGDPFLLEQDVAWLGCSLLHKQRVGQPRLSPCIESMRLGTRQECVGSSPRVSGVCQDSAREFAKRRLRLAGRLSGVAEKLTGSWDGLVMDILAIMIVFN